jgi:hypothetical protein
MLCSNLMPDPTELVWNGAGIHISATRGPMTMMKILIPYQGHVGIAWSVSYHNFNVLGRKNPELLYHHKKIDLAPPPHLPTINTLTETLQETHFSTPQISSGEFSGCRHSFDPWQLRSNSNPMCCQFRPQKFDFSSLDSRAQDMHNKTTTRFYQAIT